MGLSVSAVRGRGDLRDFIELPYRLHAGTPWVPPLRVERRMYLSRRLNPYFRHGEAQYFIARRDGRVVGRISAQIDRNAQLAQGNTWGHFGFAELEDDPEILPALRDAAAAWLRERGCDRMVGPFDLTMNDECGLLIEGYERPPMVRQPWQPPYYLQRFEEAGFTKEVDLFMWALHISGRDRLMPVLLELAAKLEPEHGVRIRHMTRRRLRRDLDFFAEIYNSAWRRNWGFVPFTKPDIDTYHVDLQLVFDRLWFMVAETLEGEPVGMAITVPDVNQVLAKMNGRLLPLGWWWFLTKRRRIDRCRVGFLGVKPEWQHAGVAAGLYVEHFDMAEIGPVIHGEMGWILETNDAMNRGMEAMGGEIVKRYRVFGQAL